MRSRERKNAKFSEVLPCKDAMFMHPGFNHGTDPGNNPIAHVNGTLLLRRRIRPQWYSASAIYLVAVFLKIRRRHTSGSAKSLRMVIIPRLTCCRKPKTCRGNAEVHGNIPQNQNGKAAVRWQNGKLSGVLKMHGKLHGLPKKVL